MKIKHLIFLIVFAQAVVFGSCSKTETETPSLSLPETYSIAEGNAGYIPASMELTLSTASDKIVSLTINTQDGTAIAGDDFIAIKDSIIVFQPGELSKLIAVKVLGNINYENDESFFVTASNAKNCNLSKNRCTITITNDDPFSPVVNLASKVTSIEGTGAGNMAKVKVMLSDAFDKEVSITYSTLDGSAKAGIDYTPVSEGVLNFSPGQTVKYIEIALTGDEILEFNKTFKVIASNPINATTGNVESEITINDDDTFIPEIMADGPITPATYEGWNLVWADEFEGNSLNLNWWTHETGGGGWGNNELEIYTNSPENSFVYDGKLNIVATKNNSVYNSARLKTAGKKEFTYGRIDIRAKMPVGQGIWPALWMLGGNIGQVGWPACGEIDIMEYLGHDITKTYGTAHYNNNGHQYKGGSYALTGGEGYNEKFHVFSILWQENSIVWYVDYHKFFEVTNSSINFESFKLPQFFIFNVAVGGNWPGNPNTTTVFPQKMMVDYVRVFAPQQ